MHFPVSFQQQQLWVLDQLEPGRPTYNMPYGMWLDGPLDVGALQRALDAVAARHAALRTTIVALDGVPEQVVTGTAVVPIERVEVPAGLDAQARTRRAEAIADEVGHRPFDLAAGPLVRAALIGAGPDRQLFVLVMHHVIGDGISAQILFDELSVTYRAAVNGTPVSLPTLWMEYGDYAVWQRDRIRGEELERQLGYWREQLRGAPRLLRLPSDWPRPARLSSRGEVASVTVDADASRRLAAVAGEANATLFMVYLAGFAAVLSRWAHQDDVVITTQVAGRTHAELEPMIGMFTNTVVLRFPVSGDPTFAGLLERVRDVTADALSHQQLPFEKLIDDLGPEVTLAHAPIAQVNFLYQAEPPPELDLPGVTARGEWMYTATSKLDLTLFADTSGEATRLLLQYSTDLFGPAWAERFLAAVARLLEHAAGAPGTLVADLCMISDAERHELVIERNRPEVPAGDNGGLTDVRRLYQASRSRVIDASGSVPMSAVCDRAARIARVLADNGAGPDTPVGVCTERDAGMLAAVLGAWWAGGAYVPLEPSLPRARLAMMAHGIAVRFVVCDSANHDLAVSVADGAVVICADDPAVAAASPLDPVPVPGSALAYISFTSGSTGQPKGVGIEHRGVANLLASFQRLLDLSSDDRFVAATPLSFDIHVLELLLPPISGADIVIATADDGREADRLRSLIERTGVTVMQATPQRWRLLESAGGVPATVRLRLCGAEPLPADLAERLLAPGVTLWNVYGPTETTVWVTARVVSDAATAAQIGLPIDHTRVYILDDRLMPVPAGVVGEICLAGPGVARGYYGQPRLTARSFRPDPWSSEPGARMYRTGDLGRWLDGSRIELIGRNDHQVKVYGYRIECGEIEAVLRAHRDVRQAVVLAAPRAGELALVGYIVPRRNSVLAQPGADVAAELGPHLRAVLPDYMVPSLVVALPALPLTAHAKVDRAALPAPDWGTQMRADDRVAPRKSVEETLVRICTELLAVREPIGVHDNLFSLGGRSLTATRLVARIADTYGVSLPVHHVFSSPTVAELAEIISADRDFGRAAGSAQHAELDALSDEDLDELLRAALAQRNRRRAMGNGPDS